jgi:hypothetical protein
MFSPELWNQFRRVMEQRPRHSCHMESNNSKLQKLIKGNPSVWDFMLGLRSAYKGDFALVYQVPAGFHSVIQNYRSSITIYSIVGMGQWGANITTSRRCSERSLHLSPDDALERCRRDEASTSTSGMGRRDGDCNGKSLAANGSGVLVVVADGE